MKLKVLTLFSSCLFFLYSCSKEPSGDLTGELPADTTGVPQISTKVILTGYEIIWGMDFLPNGDLVFGEKQGKLYLKKGETITEISGFPAVLSSGQGGLLDIRVHPIYSDNGFISILSDEKDIGYFHGMITEEFLKTNIGVKENSITLELFNYEMPTSLHTIFL
jgi:hypothetical protein